MLEPIGERVILKPIKEAEKTSGGIYIPDEAKEKKKQGEVVAVGKSDKGALPLQKGEKVLYGGYSNEEIEIDGTEYVIVEFKDILAKVTQ